MRTKTLHWGRCSPLHFQDSPFSQLEKTIALSNVQLFFADDGLTYCARLFAHNQVHRKQPHQKSDADKKHLLLEFSVQKWGLSRACLAICKALLQPNDSGRGGS